jgi:pilus assembly protein CpaB
MGRVLVALLTLIVAGGLGVAVLLARRPPSPPVTAQVAPPPRVVPNVSVLVAARPVRAGALLQPEDMASAPLPEDQVPPGASKDSVDARTALRGAMVRESLDAGRPITASEVLRPGDRGFLAAVLAPGMRAVSVAVDSVSGTAGLIWPGDRVDLILTQAIEDAAQPLGKRVVGESVLRDVRVIAVDQQLMEGGQQSQPQGGIANNNRVLTLEVTEATAERVAVAMRLGRLAAIVRSAVAGSAPEPAPRRAVWADDVSPALRPSAASRSSGGLRVFRASQQPAMVKF